jgi:hypothetical protein
MKFYRSISDIVIKILLSIVFILAGIYCSATNDKIRSLNERVVILEKGVSTQQLRYLELLAGFCNETNQRSRKPQELSLDQCREYAKVTLNTYSKVPTPTALERDTTRRGLGVPEPTPCDPYVALCTKFP